MDKTIFKGRIFDVAQKTIRLPDGREAVRDMIIMNGAAAVLPILDDGRIALVRQYRTGAQADILELPAGMLETGEDPLVCAKRELKEETGYTAASVEFLLKYYSGAGFNTEMLYIYTATGLTPGETHFDGDEFLTTEIYGLNTALGMIDSGEIMDAKTIAALLMYERRRGKL